MRQVRIGLAAALVIAAAAMPQTAQAYWRGGVFFGFPAFGYYAPPPVYYAPPVYAPPPVIYQRDPAPTIARSCDAGAYVCPLERNLAPGAPCSCPANRGRVSGYAR